ncbi:MAG: thioredoxin [Pyrobaculum sp.]
MISIVLHHTCKSSYTLYKALKGTPGVEFKMATTPYFSYLSRYVLSVPAVFKNGELVLLDPVEPSDVQALLRGDTEKDLDADEAVENFARGVMASQALLSVVMLYKSLKPVLDPVVVSVLTRARYHKQEDKTPQFLNALKTRDEEIVREHWEHFVKILTFGMVREMYWLGVDIDDVEKSHVKMWILAKATAGRLGLPHPKPDVPQAVVDAVYTKLKESGRRYMDKVIEEQSTIMGDSEFMSLIQE